MNGGGRCIACGAAICGIRGVYVREAGLVDSASMEVGRLSSGIGRLLELSLRRFGRVEV